MKYLSVQTFVETRRAASLAIAIILLLSPKINAQTVDFSADEVCYGSHTTFTASCSLDDSLIKYYHWDMDNDSLYDDASGKTVTNVFSADGTHLVGLRITATDNSTYTLSAPKSIIVNPTPMVNFSSDNLCEGKSAQFYSSCSISSGSIIQYNWDFDNNGSVDGTGDTVIYNCGSATTYNSKLEATSDKYCKSFTTKTTTVFNQPTASFSIPTTICTGNTANFTNTSSLSTDKFYLQKWSYGDDDESISENGEHNYTAAGSYTVKLKVVSENYCSDSVSLDVTAYTPPTVEIICSDSLLYSGGSSSLTHDGTYSSVKWSTTETTNSIEVNTAGVYWIEVTDANGCKNTSSIKIISKEVNEVILSSNILTPNNDGANDYLTIEDIDAFGSCELLIFNMWGEEIFSNSNYDNKWPEQNNSLDAGAYYYVIIADDLSVKGNINILQ